MGSRDVVLFSPGGYENFLNARHFGNFIPSVALLFALVVNASKRSFAVKAMANAALAFLATYSMPNGLFLWLFAWPIEWPASVVPSKGRSAARWMWRGFYGMGGALISAYFLNYHKPPETPDFVSPFTHFGLVLHYLTLWCGNLFFVSSSDPLLRGGVVLMTFVLLAIAALILAGREQRWSLLIPAGPGCFYTRIRGNRRDGAGWTTVSTSRSISATPPTLFFSTSRSSV